MGIISPDQPGAASQPEGDGPVTLSDRTEPGGQGSPDTNQGRAEPMSPTPDHPEPAVDLPDLSSMNVGSADPQSPSHAAAGGALKALHPDLPTPSVPAVGEGEARRAPGSLGTVPTGESVETDVQAGADRMAPHGPASRQSGARQPLADGVGDPASSPAAGDAALEGSSEEHEIVTGVRMPDTR